MCCWKPGELPTCRTPTPLTSSFFSCMYGFTALVPFQGPAPSHPGDRAEQLIPAIKDTGFPTPLAVRTLSDPRQMPPTYEVVVHMI